jgi:NADH-quinone oxidoreductase subunit L
MGGYVAGMFHLITHAFFKALLFLSAGSVILGLERGHHHSAHDHHHGHHDKPNNHGHHHDDNQAHGEEVFDPGDMRNMGGIWRTMPITFVLYIIGTLALAGIFPFAGFWSKDEILLDASRHFPLIYGILSAAAFLTAFYMGRQIWMVFFGEARTDAAKHAQESPLIMTAPLMILAILSFAGGALNLPFAGYHTLGHWLEYTLGHVEALPLNLQVAGISSALAITAIVTSWILYGLKPLQPNQIDPLKQPLGAIFSGMEGKWFIDEIYDTLILTPFKNLALFLSEVIDWRFWHDFMHDSVVVKTYHWLGDTVFSTYADRKGIDAFFNSWGSESARLSAVVCKTQNGLVRSYALAILLGFVIMLSYLGYTTIH